jgi:ubiquinone/menaquinone biosynthesis C-methylase UbiE
VTVAGTNFGKAAADYGRYRAGFPDSLFARLTDFGIGAPGQTIVDVGTGTGTLARGFALRGCQVIGLDPDARMLQQARVLDQAARVEITYTQATAEATGLGAGIADVVTAGQCWHWFDQARAIQEAQRILKPGGRLVIAHFDWLPLAGNVVEASENLIRHHNPKWHLHGGVGMYPQWLPGLGAAGMRDIETFSYDVDVSYESEAWRGRIRASAGIAALDPREVAEFDAQLAQLLAGGFPADVLSIPHRVFAISARAPDDQAS